MPATAHTPRPVTPREAREAFEEQVTRQVKGIFRDFESYLRDKYGLLTVDELAGMTPAEKARFITLRFNRHGESDSDT